MSRFRCNACQGEYDDVGADGVRYFHACPPIDTVSILRAGVAVRVPLAELAPTDELHVVRDGKLVDVVASDRLETDRLATVQSSARVGHRDENVIPVDGKPGQAKSAGAGVTPIAAIAAQDVDARVN